MKNLVLKKQNCYLGFRLHLFYAYTHVYYRNFEILQRIDDKHKDVDLSLIHLYNPLLKIFYEKNILNTYDIGEYSNRM